MMLGKYEGRYVQRKCVEAIYCADKGIVLGTSDDGVSLGIYYGAMMLDKYEGRDNQRKMCRRGECPSPIY